MTWSEASRLPLWALAIYVLCILGMPLVVALMMGVAGFLRSHWFGDDAG